MTNYKGYSTTRRSILMTTVILVGLAALNLVGLAAAQTPVRQFERLDPPSRQPAKTNPGRNIEMN